MQALTLKIRMTCALALLLVLAAPVLAQSSPAVQVQVHQARLSIPFGEVSGRLIQVGDYLVFLDEDQPNQSFAITRAHIRNMNGQDDLINVELRQPVRDRSGQRDRLTFQLSDRSTVPIITAWAGAGGAGTTASSGSTGTTMGRTTQQSSAVGNDPTILASYPVQHNHVIGHCSGQLIIRQNMVAYESIDDLDDSRQWVLRDIRELDLDNPYELDVRPFSGDEYTFRFQGRGMDTGVYQELVSRVTAARVAE